LAILSGFCNIRQRLETPLLSLVAGAGVSGSSPLVGSLFCLQISQKQKSPQ
jgi:hypothetical protein